MFNSYEIKNNKTKNKTKVTLTSNCVQSMSSIGLLKSIPSSKISISLFNLSSFSCSVIN